ncbi:hypothetical protein EJB05_20889, partial [Eragrostis curvula]
MTEFVPERTAAYISRHDLTSYTQEEKSEPLENMNDDPVIRFLNWLYAKKRKELQEHQRLKGSIVETREDDGSRSLTTDETKCQKMMLKISLRELAHKSTMEDAISENAAAAYEGHVAAVVRQTFRLHFPPKRHQESDVGWIRVHEPTRELR